VRAYAKIVLCICVFLSSTSLNQSWAQQRAQYSQFNLNKYLFNPAFGGLERSLSVTAFYRTQWDQINGTPVQQGVNAHMPVYLLGGSVGFSLLNETAGLERNTSIRFSYNAVRQLDFGLFSLGASAGLVQKSIDFSRAQTPDGQYIASINHNDPILGTVQTNGINAIWSVGGYFSNYWTEIGFTIENLPSHNIKLSDLNISLSPNYIVFAEFKALNEIRGLKLKPSFMINRNHQETQITGAVLTEYGNIFGGMGLRGFSSSSLESLVFVMGIQIDKNYRVSYSYDYGLNSIGRISDGSHEFVFNYNLQKLIGIGLDPPVIYNPRNL